MLDKNGNKLLIGDIAKAAGVSPTAVSRYLNSSGYLSPEKGEAIRRALEALGAQTEGQTSVARGRNRRVFAFLTPPYSPNASAQFATMSSVFSEIAKSKGYATKVYSVNLSELTLIQALEQVLTDHPSGILVPVVPMLSLDRQTQQFIQDCEVPIVLFSEFATPYSRIHSIINDFDTGISLSIAHLRDMGCRRLALLSPPDTQSKSAGLQQTAFRAGTQEEPWLEKAQIYTYPWKNGEFAKAGYACAKLAFSQDPDIDGIIGWTDAFTAGILWYLYEIGKRVPQDVKIVTLNEDYSSYLCPPVTTYSFSNQALCTEAVNLLITLQSPAQRKNIRHLYIAPIFTIRGSTDAEMLPKE